MATIQQDDAEVLDHVAAIGVKPTTKLFEGICSASYRRGLPNCGWLSCLVFLLILQEQVHSFVNCEFTYGYETEEYTLAFVNLTYIDPHSGKIHSEKEETGKFSVGRVEAVNGVIVHASSSNHTRHDGCQPLDTDNLPQEQWIALVQYGNCGESTKLRHIANSNATAAVVYGDKPSPRLVKMNHRVFQIVSLFITKEKGEEIITLLDNGTRVMMYVTVGSHNTFRYANINRTSVLFVSISFIILMIISLAWLVFYYVQRFRYIHAKDLLARRLCNAAKKALDKIPVKTIRPGDREAEGDYECCAVCIEPFKVGEVVRTLPCKHTFHKSCVDPWLLEQRSCPMCKMDILKYYGLVFTGSQESVLNIDDNELHAHHGHAEVEILHVPVHQPDTPSHLSSSDEPRLSSPPISSEIAIIEGTLISPLHTLSPNGSPSLSTWRNDNGLDAVFCALNSGADRRTPSEVLVLNSDPSRGSPIQRI